MQTIKCVCVGDGAVGKTSLLMTYSQDKFPTEYVPTIFDNFAVGVMVEGRPVLLNLWDTAGQGEFHNLRLLAYPETDVVLICYSIASVTSYSNAKNAWAPEVKNHVDPSVPVILVGLQADRRNDPNSIIDELVSESRGLVLQREIGAVKYVECSALTGEGLKYMFDEVIKIAVNGIPNPEKNDKCCRIL